jgi:hypothetical protein
LARDLLSRAVDPREALPMLDVAYIGLIVSCLALSWGLVELCDAALMSLAE